MNLPNFLLKIVYFFFLIFIQGIHFHHFTAILLFEKSYLKLYIFIALADFINLIKNFNFIIVHKIFFQNRTEISNKIKQIFF